MRFGQFKLKVRKRWAGYTIRFQTDGAQFTAYCTHPDDNNVGVLCQGNPYSNQIRMFINNELVGTM